jgi:hypothetical protein
LPVYFLVTDCIGMKKTQNTKTFHVWEYWSAKAYTMQIHANTSPPKWAWNMSLAHPGANIEVTNSPRGHESEGCPCPHGSVLGLSSTIACRSDNAAHIVVLGWLPVICETQKTWITYAFTKL